MAIAVLVCVCGENAAGGLGRHRSNINNDDFRHFMHWRFFASLTNMVGISLVKISIAFFLRRFVPNKNYQRFLLGAIIFLIAFMISCAGTIIFNCGDKVSANWNFSLRASGEAKCFTNKVFTDIGLFNSSINIATDVLFAVLPIPIIWKLQANLRTKITLICILSLGIFACIASIIKTVIQSTTLADPDATYHDRFFMWNMVELNVGIIAASLPALRPLFAKILGATQRLTSDGRSNNKQYGEYDKDGLAYRKGNSAKRTSRTNRSKDYQQFDSNSTELGPMGSSSNGKVFDRDDRKAKGVTSVVTVGDDDSDKIMLDQPEFHAVGDERQWSSPPRGGITKTTTVQITTY